MKKRKMVITNIEPLLVPMEEVKRLMKNWQQCLPILLGDLFTQVTNDGIIRYDTYKLGEENVKFIKELNKLYEGNNVRSISVIMGKKDIKESILPVSIRPSFSQFIPILLVELKKPYFDDYFYYFPTTLHLPVFSLSTSIALRSKINSPNNSGDDRQSLSPKVAELFIVNWQALGDTELIGAFDCLAPEATIEVESEDKTSSETLFTQQKLLRVRQYNYDEIETRAIFDNMNESEDINFFISLGAGLSVADYHPFNFRPIVRIESIIMAKSKSKSKSKVKAGRLAEEVVQRFYDTSRPCPPWCKPDPLVGQSA